MRHASFRFLCVFLLLFAQQIALTHAVPAELPPVVVTGNPRGSDQFQPVQRTSVLDGGDLSFNRGGAGRTVVRARRVLL